MSLSWCRLWADAVDDDKLRLLAFEDRWHFIAMLCLKAQGVLDERDESLKRQRIGIKLGLDSIELETVMKRLVTVGLLNAAWHPKNWGKRQYKSDSSTSRVRAFRKRFGNVSETDQRQNRTETEHINPSPSAFDRFWEAYPKKVGKKPAQDLWKRRGLDSLAERICSDVAARPTTEQWQKGYIPNPATYLSQERWNDELKPKEPRWV